MEPYVSRSGALLTPCPPHARPRCLQAGDNLWKLLLCATVFGLVGFVTALLTKLLSTHFYRTGARGGAWFCMT